MVVLTTSRRSIVLRATDGGKSRGPSPPSADDLERAHGGRSSIEVDDAHHPRPNALLATTLTLYLKLKDALRAELGAVPAAGGGSL